MPERFAWMDAARGRTVLRIEDVPEGKYRALRFHIGPDADANAADTAKLAAEHPLNANLNGLHWIWQGAAQSMFGRMRPGASYAVWARVRAESASGQALSLLFEQRDGAGSRYFNVSNSTGTSSAWAFLTRTFTLNVTRTLNDILVYVEGPAAGVDLRVDDVSVVPLSGLRRAGAGRNVLVGGVTGSWLNSDTPFERVVGTDYSFAGADNEMKFDALHPAQNTYSYANADTILDHATAHGQQTRGHVLLWHGQVPGWVSGGGFSTAQLQSIARAHQHGGGALSRPAVLLGRGE